jgi:hydrogenase maturation protease
LEQTQSTDWRFSLHSFGLREALRVLAPNVPPPPISVIGVEPLSLEYGLGLSAPVAAALPQVTALAHRIIADWRAGDRLVTAGADAETETLALT